MADKTAPREDVVDDIVGKISLISESNPNNGCPGPLNRPPTVVRNRGSGPHGIEYAITQL
jgi:hypothetical protein